MSHLTVVPISSARPASDAQLQRSVGLGVRVRTFGSDTYDVHIEPVGGNTSDFRAIRISCLHVLGDEEQGRLRRAGMNVQSRATITVDLPRALWRNLPASRGALRLRYRAQARISSDGIEVQATALHLFPDDGCRYH